MGRGPTVSQSDSTEMSGMKIYRMRSVAGLFLWIEGSMCDSTHYGSEEISRT